MNRRYLIFLALTASLGGLLFGFDIAIITGAGPFLTQHFHLTDLSLGWAFSSLLFGCVVGSAITGRLTDSLGRRKPMLAVAVLFAITSLATGLAPSFTTFIIARFIGGLAVGAVSVLAPMYVVEVSPPAMRGRMCTTYQLSIVFGIVISYFIDYAPSILKSAGWKIDAALFSTFVLGFTNLSFTLVSFWVIDRYGRKPLYIVGSLGMTVVLVLLAMAAAGGHFQGYAVLILIMAYIAFFASCIGPVFWTLVPEIFPNRIRGTAMAVPVLTQWVANAVVVLFFPLAFNQIGKAVTFGFLAVMALTQAIFTIFSVPETKNKSLEEIELLWLSKSL